jgi:nitrogen fixation NifU-like protein
MPGLEDLYREIILDHYRSPRNRGELPPPATTTEGTNPLCGDEIRIFLDASDGVVHRVGFTGHGCSISQASASMMTAAIKGKRVDEVRAIVRRFKSMMTIESDEGDADDGAGDGAAASGGAGSGGDASAAGGASLGDLEALQGVVRYPVRIKCAVLAWNTLLEGLHAGEPAQ